MLNTDRLKSMVLLVSIAVVAATLGGCRLFANYDMATPEQGRRDQRVSDHDGAEHDGRWRGDGPRDGAPSDGLPDGTAPHDTTPSDLAPSKSLTCNTPEPVSGTAALQLSGGPTLRTSGLTLVAKRSKSPAWVQTTRLTWGQTFREWKETSNVLAQDFSDPTFFTLSGTEYLITARNSPAPLPSKPRHLELCDTPTMQCDTITLESPQDMQIHDDVDGPEVVVLSNGKMLMVHNVGTTANGNGDVYFAHPKTKLPKTRTDLLTWVTSRVPALALPTVKEDDPTLSPDGLVILFFSQSGSTKYNDLWISRRASLTAKFPPPILLATANSAGNDSEPSLAKVPGNPGSYELFFMSDRDSTAHVYRSVCSR